MPWFWPEEILIDGEEKVMLGLRKGRNSLKKTKHFYDLYHLRRKNCEWEILEARDSTALLLSGLRRDPLKNLKIEKRSLTGIQRMY